MSGDDAEKAGDAGGVPFSMALIAGGCAGTAVDVALFPIDTVKTRLQAAEGFWQAGGFRGIYRGLGAAALGSAPGAALFFSTYETLKPFTGNFFGGGFLAHSVAASFGEVAACLVRVPTEVVKQRMQTGQYGSVNQGVFSIMNTEGVRGFYVGYGSTVLREIPFSFIQFPIWERLKVRVGELQGSPCNPLQGAACGSLAGGFSAAVTTPLDVVKTRLMLGKAPDGTSYTKSSREVALRIYREEGVATFFSGIAPRTFWISLGGFVFFGAYEQSSRLMKNSGIW